MNAARLCTAHVVAALSFFMGLPMARAAESAAADGTAAQPTLESTSSGLYLRLATGLGVSQGRYSYGGMTTSVSSNAPSVPFRYTVGLAAPELGLHLAGGYIASSRLALGAELSGVLQGPVAQQGPLGNAQIGPFSERVQFGPFVDFYPRAQSRLHLQAGLQIAMHLFGVAISETYTSSNVSPRNLLGGIGYLGVACDLGAQPRGASLFARTYVGYFADADSHYLPLSVQLGASFAWF